MPLPLLLAWYNEQKRDLPWRKTRNAYRIFISELMLQQTQVDRVVPKYQKWIAAIPDWKHLAISSTQKLINLWAGLGYNRRAVYAREAARDVMANGVPTTEEGWRTLKGVGPYMAAALTEFVNHQRAIVVDTNVRRVVGRAFSGKPFPLAKDDTQILRTLEHVTPRHGNHWDVPQAFMDLASSLCLPRIPLCDTCPLRRACKARHLFSPDRLAHTLARKKTVKTIEARHAEKKFPDRIYRGRILAWVRLHGKTRIEAVGPRIDGTYDPIADRMWLKSMAQRLATDGLLRLGTGDTLSLPKS